MNAKKSIVIKSNPITGEKVEIKVGNSCLEAAVIKLQDNRYALIETSANNPKYPVIFVDSLNKESIEKAIQEMGLFGHTTNETIINDEHIELIANFISQKEIQEPIKISPLAYAIASEIRYLVNESNDDGSYNDVQEFVNRNLDSIADEIAVNLNSFLEMVEQGLLIELEAIREEHIYTEEELASYIESAGFDIYHDDSDDINFAVVYEQAVNEGFKYNPKSNTWER